VTLLRLEPVRKATLGFVWLGKKSETGRLVLLDPVKDFSQQICQVDLNSYNLAFKVLVWLIINGKHGGYLTAVCLHLLAVSAELNNSGVCVMWLLLALPIDWLLGEAEGGVCMFISFRRWS